MKELEDADLDEVAGGGKGNAVFMSLATFYACTVGAIISAANNESLSKCLD